MRTLYRPLLPLAFALLSATAYAQYEHCPLDHIYGIVVVPHDPVTGNVVGGLRLTLLDSIVSARSNSQPLSLAEEGLRWENWWVARFHGYGVQCNRWQRPLRPQVLIEDLDSLGADYESMKISIPDTCFTSLCSISWRADLGRSEGRFLDNSYVVHVTLRRRLQPARPQVPENAVPPTLVDHLDRPSADDETAHPRIPNAWFAAILQPVSVNWDGGRLGDSCAVVNINSTRLAPTDQVVEAAATIASESVEGVLR